MCNIEIKNWKDIFKWGHHNPPNKIVKVLFICKKRVVEYGNSVGLVNSAEFIVNYLKSINIDAKVVVVFDANDIDREVYNYKPTHVVIHALWVTPLKLSELINKWSQVIWQIRIHSKIPFLANEGIALEWIKGYKNLQQNFTNLDLSGNSIELSEAFCRSLDIHFYTLPNIYQPKYIPPEIDKNRDFKINIGCFGAIRPLKNQLMQAMCAIAWAKDRNSLIRFHINASRVEQEGSGALKNLRNLFKNTEHELVEHEWMRHDQFLNLISTMDIGMQISLTESFNIVAADFVYVGIPIVVSPEISWMPKETQADPHDINDIVDRLHYNYHHFQNALIRMNKKYLHRYNENAQDAWRKYLKIC